MIKREFAVTSHVSVTTVERYTVTYEKQGMQSRHLSIVMRPLENQAFENFCISSSRESFCNYYSRTSIYYWESRVCVRQAHLEQDEPRKVWAYEIVC